MKFLLSLALVASLALPAQAQTFSFQSGGFFVGAPANIALDINGDGVLGTLQAIGLHFDAGTGNYIGTGHVVLQVNGQSIDDQAANVSVVPGPDSRFPVCDNVRVQYVEGIVVAGNSGGLPYAMASGVQRFDVSGATCPFEVLQFEGATGSAVRQIDLSKFNARIKAAAHQLVRSSLGTVKAQYR